MRAVNTKLIHPKMMEMLQANFFPQTCTLNAPVKGTNKLGEVTRTYQQKYTVPCRVGTIGGGEQRTPQQTYLEETSVILIQGQFHDLTEEWTVSVDGIDYNIILPPVIQNPEGALTRLTVRIIR